MKKVLFLIMLFLHVSISAQKRVCIYDSIAAHKDDIEKLDKRIAKLVKKNKNLRKYGDLKRFHIFSLYNSQSSHIRDEEYQDYSFINKLCFAFYTKRIALLFKRKYLYYDTYLITQKGEVVGRFYFGDFEPRWSWNRKYIQDMGKLFVNHQIDYAFCDGIDFDFNGLVAIRKYIFIKDDTIYASKDDDGLQLIPLEEYIKIKEPSHWLKWKLGDTSLQSEAAELSTW